VSHNLGKVNRILQLGFEIGMYNPPLPLAEPWPVKDNTNAGRTGGRYPSPLCGPWKDIRHSKIRNVAQDEVGDGKHGSRSGWI
jgi:hypothetical protein